MTPFDTLQALRPTYPTPMSEAQLGEMLNAVAWTHRAEGWGVIRKPSGANCPQPQTGIRMSKDLLMQLPSADYYDVLIDSDGAATPTWGYKGVGDPASFLAPVDAAVPIPPPQPNPPPPSGGSIPYNEAYAIEFGIACNEVYQQSGAAFDPGMIAVQATRAAFDYYVGGMAWADSKKKHVNEFRHEYNLPPI